MRKTILNKKKKMQSVFSVGNQKEMVKIEINILKHENNPSEFFGNKFNLQNYEEQKQIFPRMYGMLCAQFYSSYWWHIFKFLPKTLIFLKRSKAHLVTKYEGS